MKELLQRSLFGLLYVVVVVLSLQFFTLKSLLLLTFLLLGLKEFSQLLPFHYNTILLPALFIFFTFFLIGYTPAVEFSIIKVAIVFSLIVLFIPLIYFTFDKIQLTSITNSYLAIFYIVIPFSLALLIEKELLLAVFIIIWASDTFAYLTGKYFGKHKLAKKISPKKTIEGFVGGMLGSLLIALVIYYYIEWNFNLNIYKFLFLALLIVIFGTLGDLLESRFKRLAGVKDSGNIIPGHGGILDRLDSFILAIPFTFAYLFII